MKFTRKPVEVDAVLWTGENIEEVQKFGEGAVRYTGTALRVGSLRAEPGDWIVRDSSQLGVAFFPISATDLVDNYRPSDLFEGLKTPEFAVNVIGVLVDRMGGAAAVTQAELNSIVGKTMMEKYDEDTDTFHMRLSQE